MGDLYGPDWERRHIRGDGHAVFSWDKKRKYEHFVSCDSAPYARRRRPGVVTHKPEVRFCLEGSDIEVFTNWVHGLLNSDCETVYSTVIGK